jgi:hypothetical protein
VQKTSSHRYRTRILLAILTVLLLGHLSTRSQAPTDFDGLADDRVSKQAVSEDVTANDEIGAPNFGDIFICGFAIFGCIAWAAVFVVMFIIIRDGE